MKESLEKIISDAKWSYQQSAEQNREVLESIKGSFNSINESTKVISKVEENLIIFNNKRLINADEELDRIKRELHQFTEKFIEEAEQRIQKSVSTIPTEIIVETKLNSQDVTLIDKLNRRLNIPRYSVYMFVSGVLMMIIGGFFMYFSFKNSSKSVQQIRAEYVKVLNSEGIILVRKEERDLNQDVLEWMNLNPKIKKWFVKWRKEDKGR